jgi:hypothetical protein
VHLLWLLPDLNYSSAARQAIILAPELHKLGHRLELAVLRGGGPLTAAVQAAEIPLHELSQPHHVPFHCIGTLEKLLRSVHFDLIHAWRLPTIRVIATLRMARTNRPRVIVSQMDRGGRWNPLDRLLRPKADRVVPDLGQPNAVPLAVALPDRPIPPLDAPIPAGSRWIMTLGQLTPDHGFRDAVWAFDVLKFVYPELHLLIVGDGPERNRLVQFSQRLGGKDIRTHFVGAHPDAALWMRQATVVWVPSRRPCGEQVILEAQASGVPVAAAQQPTFVDIIADQVSGILVKPGDPVGLAMATRPLLDDPARCAPIINAATNQLSHHHPSVVAHRWAQIYCETCQRPVD